jgi:uncharacterized membrane protein YdjX (TVP38/TMEM64 family)
MKEPSSASAPPVTAGIRRLPLIRILLAAIAAVAVVVVGARLAPHLGEVAQWVRGLGLWAPLVFIAGYAVATVAFVPGSALTLAAGPLFGLGWGVLYVFCGAVLGSSAAFLIARYLARGAVERKIQGNPKFAAIDRAVSAEGRRIVLLLRLSPAFPFNLLNYALGLTRVRFADYLVASVGMLPGTLLYVYVGKVGGDAAAAAGGMASTDLGTWVLRIVGLAATIAVATLVTRIARRALRAATGE